jgi:hypothetical protein
MIYTAVELLGEYRPKQAKRMSKVVTDRLGKARDLNRSLFKSRRNQSFGNLILRIHEPFLFNTLVNSMLLSQANKILLGSCVVVVPRTLYKLPHSRGITDRAVSIYGGTILKERYLASELEKVSDREVTERRSRARIVE